MKRLLFAVLALSLAAPLACSRKAIPYSGRTKKAYGIRPEQRLHMHVFETGRFDAPAWGVYRGGRGRVKLDQPAFLIEHPEYGLVLYEAGLHPDVAKDPKAYVGSFLYTTKLLRMEQAPGQDARTQLKDHGFDPDNVKAIVVSHFHPEHGGAVEAFPKAGIATDSREYAYVMDDPKYNFLKKEYDEVENWWQMDFGGSEQLGPFEGYIDLAGDGTIMIVSTPGHTPGHVSLFVRLPEGDVLLAGDVAWTQGNIDKQSIGIPFISVDGKGARKSLGQLLKFIEQNPAVTVVPGHDLAPLREKARRDITLHRWPPGDEVYVP